MTRTSRARIGSHRAGSRGVDSRRAFHSVPDPGSDAADDPAVDAANDTAVDSAGDAAGDPARDTVIDPPTDPGNPVIDAPTAALTEHLAEVDDRLQERTIVLAHVQRVDAQELFALTRADLWAHREELAAVEAPDRLDLTWRLVARHARMLARRAEGRSVPPIDHAAVGAARALPPPWRHLPGQTLLGDPETAVFRAMAHISDPARSVLVLRWLGVGADDVADEMSLGADAVERLLREARDQLHQLLAAGSGR